MIHGIDNCRKPFTISDARSHDVEAHFTNEKRRTGIYNFRKNTYLGAQDAGRIEVTFSGKSASYTPGKAFMWLFSKLVINGRQPFYLWGLTICVHYCVVLSRLYMWNK